MSELVAYMKEAVQDPQKASSHIMTLLNAVPCVGGLIHSNITEYLTTRRMAHIEAMIHSLGARIATLEAQLDPEYAKSEEYAHLVVHGILRSQYEHRALKLKMMGYMLGEMASGTWRFSFDVKKGLFDALSDMGEHHLELLGTLASRGVQDIYSHQDTAAHVKELVAAATCLRELDEPRRTQVVMSACDWLTRNGLVERCSSIMEGGYSYFEETLDRNKSLAAWRYSISALGLDFVAMIREQEAPGEHK